MKEGFNYIFELYQSFFISYDIFACVLAYWIFKKRSDGKFIFEVIRWIFILYGTLSVISLLLNLNDVVQYWNYSPYFMLTNLFTAIIPLTLLFNKLGKSYKYILLISGFTALFRTFEKFVIVVTSLHRDYIFDTSQDTGNLPFIVSSVFVALEFAAMGYVLVLAFKGLLKKLKPS